MKVLVVASINKGSFSPFITEQVDALRKKRITVEYFGVKGKGIKGYLSNWKRFKSVLYKVKPDVIHAHFGLCGLFANFQRKIPVITTYHGCDINVFKLRCLSIFSILLSKYNVFVSLKQYKKVKCFLHNNYSILPCGVNMDLFKPMNQIDSRKKLGINLNKTIILFSSSFERPEKNSKLAFQAVSSLPNVELIEFKGYSREQSVCLMNAVDIGLLTSLREGSPMFVKEMIACRRPIVSTDVGDVSEILRNVNGASVATFDVNDVVNKLKVNLEYKKSTYPKDWLERYDNDYIVQKLISIYSKIK